MAVNIKAQKEHQQLYANILMLTLEYPTTKEFKEHFRKDMFMKNNKAAFQHVTHFLINILNPELFQRKTWPILDTKMETEFRTEIVKYLNSLEEMKLSTIMTSHLISPGGNKFINFMFHLSRYVLQVHVRKSVNVIYPIKADSNPVTARNQLENLNKIVEDQYNKLTMKQMKFDAEYNAAKKDANITQEQLPMIRDQIKQLEIESDETFQKFNKELLPQFDQTMSTEIMERKLTNIRNLRTNLLECYELISALDQSKIMTNFHTKTESLIESLKSFSLLLKSNHSELSNPKDPNLNDYIKLSEDILNDLNVCNIKSDELNTELMNRMTQLNQIVSNFDFNLVKNENIEQKVQDIFDNNFSANLTKL